MAAACRTAERMQALPVAAAELMAATGLGVSPTLRALGELADRGLVRGDGDVWTRQAPRQRRR